MVQDAIALYDVLGFLFVRFALAAAALAPITLTRWTPRTLFVGGGIVLVLASGYLLQTTALLFATYLVSVTGSPLAPALYLGVAALISLAAALGLKETAGQFLRT